MNAFIAGLRLNELFYSEVIAPLLKLHFPDLQYSAALIGWGSDVLGYDDAESTDHNWGLRLQLFLLEQNYNPYAHGLTTLSTNDCLNGFAEFRWRLNGLATKPNENRPARAGTTFGWKPLKVFLPGTWGAIRLNR
jgi:hypothetical protein